MSNKSRAKKKSVKGVRYLAQTLTKYFNKKFPSYTSAMPKARELQAKFKKSGVKVGVASVFAVMRKKRGKAVVPKLPRKLTEPQYYFFLVDYPAYIARCDKQIWFHSKLWKKGLGDIQGGTVPDYATWFAPYVQFINSIAGQTSKDDNRYEHEWLVMCTPLRFNRNKQRYESEIISVDSNGNRITYGFNPEKQAPQRVSEPQKGKVPPTEVKVPKIEEKPAPEVVKPVPGGGTESVESLAARERLAMAEAKLASAQAEKSRQENVSNLLKLFGQGVLSKAEFKELMSKI